MSIFKKTPLGLPRKDFRQILEKEAITSPFMTGKEGREMEKKLFPQQKYGETISDRDVNERLRNLRREKFQARGLENKAKIDREIKLLEKIKR